MGCNSHISIEIQGQYSHSPLQWGIWALDIPESRNYRLYEAMAGVRGEKKNAIIAPRGIPSDIANVTAYWIKRYGEDGHTHSWLFADEFHIAVQKAGDVDRCWLAVDQLLDVLSKIYGIEHVRLIFYFDN